MTPYLGGRRLLLTLSAISAAGLLLTLLGATFDARRALAAYLIAFTYWLSAGLGALLLLCAFHATGAQWAVVLRRLVETLALPCLILAPLFIPLALGLRHLYLWVDPPADLGTHALHLLEHKRPYLNVPFFLVRAALYFALWIGVSQAISAWSRRQDSRKGDVALTVRQRRLATGSLPFLALAITFASFDWLMSLEPTWFSSIYGVYLFAGAFLCALALLTLVALRGRGATLLHNAVTWEHFHSLGKLLLAFVAFWAYIAFSQYLLIWQANLPEEVTWYQVRAGTGWRPVAFALVLCHFILPFFALLSAALKRNAKLLGAVALWCLAVHWVDLYWLILPSLYPSGPNLHWTDLTAFAGVGGAYGAFAVYRLRGVLPVPVGDPFLAHSLGYVQP